MKIPVVILSFVVICIHFANGYYLHLTNNGPVVLGATITFKAELFDDYRQPVTGTFCFSWKDNGFPQQRGKSEGYSTVSIWNVTYSREVYNPGLYEVEVVVDKCAILFWPIISARQFYNITLMLNGDMNLVQDNRTLPVFGDAYVSSEQPLTHTITLSEPDTAFMKKNATSVVSYWFLDCVYYGMTTDMKFSFNYTGQSGQERHIEALVIASYENETVITTTVAPTTTTTPNSTTTGGPTPSTAVTTPIAPTALPATTQPPKINGTQEPTSVPLPTPVAGNSSASPHTAASNSTVSNSSDDNQIKSNDLSSAVHSTTLPPEHSLLVVGKNYSGDPKLPFICLNSSDILPDPRKTYGLFQRTIKIRDPVENVTFTGTNWLKQGEMLDVGVTCNGSGPFRNCVQMYPGVYNVTGNERCENEQVLSDCRFAIYHYFKKAETYTLVIIINNNVSKKITPLAVNIYEVTKHPQLSVIIVPVACSAAAVILIVFGIAYYIQSRNRYTIEVADFDFAQASDMEYKTFRERLREAMSNAVNRTQDYVEEGNVWSPSRKYGSMQ